MSLPLPFQITPASKPNEIQSNFEKLSEQFPLSHKSLAVATPHVVDGSGEPAFANSWVNAGGGFRAARYWKDALGVVHVEGLVKDGTVGVGNAVFTLPVGYRPGESLTWATHANGAFGRVSARANGDITADVGSNVSFSINCSFKQEA